MIGLYVANDDGTISYEGNKIFGPVKDIGSAKVPLDEFENRGEQFSSNEMWKHIANINHRINISTNSYFEEKNALFTPLPLTTRMISSPGAVYGKEAIDYTDDTCPIKLKWFDLKDEVFLSESSQIYLELALMKKDVNKVYSIYNSFRKERADSTHLSEFHHIEFEGIIEQKKNEKIALNLIKRIINDLLEKNYNDLLFFLNEEEINNLEELRDRLPNITTITFERALDILYEDTGDDKYNNFTLKNFGSWEEVRLTNILKDMVLVKYYPLLEVPFYHDSIELNERKVANNSDLIWPGYREILGSGQRISSLNRLEEKTKIFNLPRADYEPYIRSRRNSSYEVTSGFGLGWERFLQGLLKMPFIWSAVPFPRVDGGIKP